MIFGFSSMGKPEADLYALNVLLGTYKLDFIELRVLGGTMDLPSYFRSREAMPAIKHGKSWVPIRLLGSSLRLTEADDETIQNFLDMAQLAEKLGALYVRVFGGGQWGTNLSHENCRHAARSVKICREKLTSLGLKVKMLLETHDAFSSSEACLKLNNILETPIEILWDSHHTWRMAGESPQQTWAKLGPLIRHVHYKDSVTDASARLGYSYVFPGKGEYSAEMLFTLLQREKFAEGVTFEWEKLWHAELPDLEEALDAFVRVIAPYRI